MEGRPRTLPAGDQHARRVCGWRCETRLGKACGIGRRRGFDRRAVHASISGTFLGDEKSKSMEANQSRLSTKTISAREMLAQLHAIPIFRQTTEQDLDCLGDVDLVDAPQGALLFDRGEKDL